MDISACRTNYQDKEHILMEDSIEIKEPFHLFTQWFSQIQKDPLIVEPNAMCLSTASKDGSPSGRFVLCKSFDKTGFRFFTHYTSNKGQQLDENSKCALTFYWATCNRSVRIEGVAEKLPFAEADTYFQKRPYQSQIGALCSNQSQPIAGRHVLSTSEKQLRATHSEGSVPRPPLWGGYVVKPHSIEFWQGQTDRIHDRIKFRRPASASEPDGVLSHQGEEGWIYERLAP